MQLLQLVQMLQQIAQQHGDIPVQCGQSRIGGIMLLHDTRGSISVSIVQRPVGSPVEGLPPYTGKERRWSPKRRWDDVPT